MTFDDYLSHDALGLADLVRRKETTAEELLECAISQVERIDPRLNAVVDRLYERARATIAAGLPDGPFQGVPILLKDMIDLQGTRVTYGSAMAKDYLSPTTHEWVRRLERAGAVVFGRTNCSEMGLLPLTEPLLHGPTRNPWNRSHSPGGSSGGSGAAVAAGIVPLAHGSDGGGSIRIPSSCCGVFGLKPSRGRNPSYAMDEPGGLAVNHGLSRSVRDSATLLDVTCGAAAGDRWWAPPPQRPFAESATIDPPKLRIGLATLDAAGHPAHPDCTTAAVTAAKLCESLGHHVEEVTVDVDGESFNRAFAVIWSSIAGLAVSLVLRELGTRLPVVPSVQRLFGKRIVSGMALKLLELKGEPAVEPFTRRLAAIEVEYSPSDLWLAWNDLQQANYKMATFFESYDLLLTPVLGQPPWAIGELSQDSELDELWDKLFSYVGYTAICNTAGLPAMSVPLYNNAAGLPIGVQFAAPFSGEALLFSVAGQLERAQPWASRRPCLDWVND